MKARIGMSFLAVFLLCAVVSFHGVQAEDVIQELKLDGAGEEGQVFTMGADGVLKAAGSEAGDSSTEGDDDLDAMSDNGVVVLGDDSFDEFVNEKSVDAPVLVEFYAPWCGHCKSLAPEYEKAAKRLKELRNPVYLAKVDATEEKKIAERFEIQGYPTLKWFRNGIAYDYDGPRQEEGIVEYMKKRAAKDWKPPPVAVVDLTSENFTDFINTNDLSLVEFYAPWCGHCKKLAPEYEKAAQRLKELDTPIPLAKVDATQESDIAQQYDVSGYPTLKVFRRGKAFEYKGERTELSIVEYMQGQQGDPSTLVSGVKALQKAMKVDDVTVVGFFEKAEDFLFQAYLEAANDIRDDYTFLHSFDAAVRDNFKVNVNSVVVFQAERFFTKYEPKRAVMEIKDDTEVTAIREFIAANDVPMMGEHNPPAKRYTARPLVLFFYTVDFSHDGKIATQLWRNKLANIANSFKGKDVSFAIADEDRNKDLFKDFGFLESGEEMNVGILDAKDKKYPMEPDDFDADNIKEFIQNYLDGKVKPIIRSQPIPKKQGLVKVVVGNTFDKIVLDPKKDVLIEMYAPWCGHCKKLEPIYKELAKKLKADKNLVIAKMDATANDSPAEFFAQGFPTIYFAPANDKSNPIKYEGGREVADFEKFLEEKATVSFGGKNAGKEEL